FVGQKFLIQSGGSGQVGFRRSQIDSARNASRLHDARAARSSQCGVADSYADIHRAEQAGATANASQRRRYGEAQGGDYKCPPLGSENIGTASASDSSQSGEGFRS